MANGFLPREYPAPMRDPFAPVGPSPIPGYEEYLNRIAAIQAPFGGLTTNRNLVNRPMVLTSPMGRAEPAPVPLAVAFPPELEAGLAVPMGPEITGSDLGPLPMPPVAGEGVGGFQPYMAGAPPGGVVTPATPFMSQARSAPLVPSAQLERQVRSQMAIPMASSPSSRRFSSTRPEFIYTNPAAAAQAAQNYQSRLQFELGQDQGYRDYLSRLGQIESAGQIARANQEFAQRQGQAQMQAQRDENALQRASAERIAGMSEAQRQYRADESAWQAWNMGDQSAQMLNRDPMARVDRKFVYKNPATGLWESRFPRVARPAPPAGITAPVPAAPSTPAMAVPEAPAAAPLAAAVPTEDPGFWSNAWDFLRNNVQIGPANVTLGGEFRNPLAQ